MKKSLIICLAAACGLMSVSCKDNPAKDYEGIYNVKITPTLTLNNADQLPTIVSAVLNQNTINAATASVSDSTYSCTVALDGDDGDVKVIMLGNVYKGHVDDKGLQLDNPMDYTVDYSVAKITLHFNHSLIAPVSDDADINVLNWSASTSGDISIAGQNLSNCLTGTTKFLATEIHN